MFSFNKNGGEGYNNTSHIYNKFRAKGKVNFLKHFYLFARITIQQYGKDFVYFKDQYFFVQKS